MVFWSIIWSFLVLLVGATCWCSLLVLLVGATYWCSLLVFIFNVVVLPAARKTEVRSAVSSAEALSCAETCGNKMKLKAKEEIIIIAKEEIIIIAKEEIIIIIFENLVDEADPSLVSGLDPGPPC